MRISTPAILAGAIVEVHRGVVVVGVRIGATAKEARTIVDCGRLVVVEGIGRSASAAAEELTGAVVQRGRLVVVARDVVGTTGTARGVAGTVVHVGVQVEVAGERIGTTGVLAGAVVEVGRGGVIRCGVIGTATKDTGAVIEKGVRLVVGGGGIRAAIAVERTGAIVLRGGRIVVAGAFVVAALDLVEVTDAIEVGVADAGSVTLVAVVGVPAGAIVIRRVGAEVAGRVVHAAGDLVLVTHTVLIEVVQTDAVTIEVGGAVQILGEQTVVVVRVGRGRIVVAGRLQLAATLGLTPAEGLELHVVAVSVGEDLDIHLATEHAVRGELTNQHTQVVASGSVGRAVQGEPAAAIGATEFDVASGLEGAHPGLALDEGHFAFTGSRIGRAGEADGHPAVVDERREGVVEHAVDAMGTGGAERILMEARARPDVGGVLGIAGHGAEEVVRALHGHVDLVRGHAVDAVLDRVDVEVVRTAGRVHPVTGTVVARPVVRGGHGVVVAGEGVRASKALQDRDGLRGRGGIAAGVHGREGPGHQGVVVGGIVRLVGAQDGGAAAVVRRFGRIRRKRVVDADGHVCRHAREDGRDGVDDLNRLDMLGAVATGISRREGPGDRGLTGTLPVLGLFGQADGHVATIICRLDGGRGHGGVTGDGRVGRECRDGRSLGVDHGDDLDAHGFIAAGIGHTPRPGDVLADAGVHVEQVGIVVGHRVLIAIVRDGHVTRGGGAEVGTAGHRQVSRSFENRSVVVDDGQRPGGGAAVAGGVRGRVGPGDDGRTGVAGGGLLQVDREVGTGVFHRHVGCGQRLLASEGEVGREVHKGRSRRVDVGTEGEHHELTEAVGLSVREDLHVELAAGRAIGGQLGEQDALVSTRHTVGVVAGHVPGATEEAVNGEILTGLELGGPAFAVSLGIADVGLTGGEVGHLVDANGQPAVELQRGEGLEQKRVDAIREESSELILVERARAGQCRGVLGITADRADEVVGIRGVDVVAVGRHARHAVHGHDLLLEAITRAAGGHIGTAEEAGPVVVGGAGAVVAGRGVRTTGDLLSVADAVGISVGEAIAVTVDVLIGRERASSVVGQGIRIVVAGRGVHAPGVG